MTWEHNETFRRKGDGWIYLHTQQGESKQATYQLAKVTTGKSRVFKGYRVLITLADSTQQWQGDDADSIVCALKNCAHAIATDGLLLNVAGLHSEFSESGLSYNSGFGYLNEREGAIHIMEPIENFDTLAR